MAILSKITHSSAVDYFKELPFYNRKKVKKSDQTVSFSYKKLQPSEKKY